MTDYDAIRTCCQDKAMCKRCWGFIVLACKVLDRILREDFDFHHLLYVYSGRRGIHIWVSDAAACDLTDDQRKAIVGYIELVKGGVGKEKKVNLSKTVHSSIEYVHYCLITTHDLTSTSSAIETLGKGFVKLCLKDQEVFKTTEQWELLLRLLPDSRTCFSIYYRLTTDAARRNRQYPPHKMDSKPQTKLSRSLERRSLAKRSGTDSSRQRQVCSSTIGNYFTIHLSKN